MNKPLSSIATIKLGQSFRGSAVSSEPMDEGVRLIQISDVQRQIFDDSSMLSYAAIEFNKVKEKLLIHDILLPIRGVRVDAMLMGDFSECTIATNQIAIIRASDQNDPGYLFWYFNSPDGQEKLKSLHSGATVQKITKVQLEMIDIPVPDIDAQKRIGDLYLNWLEQEKTYEKLLKNGQELTNSLCSELMG